MKNIYLLFLAGICLSGCTATQPALSTEQTAVESYAVKGRQGLLINQKLSFGNYQTSRIKRSWTRGGADSFGIPVGRYSQNLISLDRMGREQDFFFEMQDVKGNRSQAFALSQFSSRDVNFTKNNINSGSQNFFGINLGGENLFYLQLWLNDDVVPWELVLDNDAAQVSPKNYQGFFSIDENRYYRLVPIIKVKAKNGSEELIGGSIGYEIFNRHEEMVAAVSLVDQGKVYFLTQDPEEKFLMANLFAAILLQQDLTEL